MFKKLNLKTVYDTSKDDLIEDLFIPLLDESVIYKRGVGYFSSGWLKMAAKGVVSLAEKKGEIKIITSPILEEKDWYYLVKGERAKKDKYLKNILHRNLNNLKNNLENDTLNTLAWLIADGVLEIKFAIPKNKRGDFHDKFGIFVDENYSQVAIHGSYNDSIKGTLNGESFSVFKSWVDGQKEYVNNHINRFNKIYNNNNNYFEIYNMPKAIKNDIAKLKKPGKRPYKIKKRIKKRGYSLPEKIDSLYEFQKKAIQNWFENDGIGLFNMATGTGKTITAITCSLRLIRRLENLIIIVAVPFKHLLNQWKEDFIEFGFNPLICNTTTGKRYSEVKSKIKDLENDFRNNIVILTTHITSAKTKFLSLFNNINKDILFIADEVHYYGAEYYRNGLNENYNYRIGLSATPKRWYDAEGTEFIVKYFNKEIISYPLKKAIKDGFLSKYNYYPHIVELDDNEIMEYENLTKKIAKYNNSDEEYLQKQKKKLIMIRSNIVKNAKNKKDVLKNLLEYKIKDMGLENINNTIIYCGNQETKKILEILKNLHIRSHEFVNYISNKNRKKILNHFQNGDIQILVAIKCLDEGVDIPSTENAYFLASTTNPREFVQRRGRILRKHKEKKYANVHDFIVIPDKTKFSYNYNIFKSIIRRELPRFIEFSSSANNMFESRSIIYPILQEYNLEYLLAMKPWEVYNEFNKGGLRNG